MTDLETKLFAKAAALCSHSEHCTQDIKSKLQQWGGTTNYSIDTIIDKLVEEKYIDDKRYAEAYAKDKFSFNKWGRRKIIFMLKSKGITQSIAEEVAYSIDDETYKSTLESLICSKRRSLRGENEIIKVKLYNFAAARGYESDIILQTIKEVLKQ